MSASGRTFVITTWVSDGSGGYTPRYGVFSKGEQSRSDRQKYSEAEIDARNAKRGLWYDPEPMAPWDYRKMKRKK
jgi:endonuclease YncB( thermonuclease family)